MRIIAFLLSAVFSGPVWAQGIFDTLGEILSSASAEESMQPWERNLSNNDWLKILENCYDRNVNPDAKGRFQSFFTKTTR